MDFAKLRIWWWSALLFPISRLGVRIFGFQHWWRILQRLRWPIAPLHTKKLNASRRTVRLIRQWPNLGVHSGHCLPRTLTLWWLLKQQKIDCTVHLGVHRDVSQTHTFEAHAWLTYQGRVLFDDSSAIKHYVELYHGIQANYIDNHN